MNILRINDFSKKEISEIINRAIAFKNGKRKYYNDQSVAAIFLEPSTRTLLSFKKAALNLKMDFFNLNIEKSSLEKGESLEDTLLNLKAMGIKNFVIRSNVKEYWKDFKEEFNLINAGDGIKNHPSQALLDAMTIKEHFGSLSNLKVVIIGDVKHSRVYSSNKELLEKFDSKVDFLGSKEFGGNGLPISKFLSEYDVIMFLRVQHERHNNVFNVDSYNSKWGLNKNNIKMIKKNSLILHPGPVNRGVEITSDLLYNLKQIKILEQVENGVYVRMALLEKLCKNI